MAERDVSPAKMPFNLKPRGVVLIIVVVAIIATVMSSFFIVDQTEEAVVLMFGRYTRTAGPGLHFKLPFGIEQNLNVPTQVIQNMSFGFRTAQPGVRTQYDPRRFPEESVMLTGDLNIVDVEWIIQYRITDARAWLFNVQDQTRTLRDISQSVVNQLVGDRAILEVIGAARANIEFEAQELMNQSFRNFGLGVNVTQVRLQNIVPPAGRVQDAFEDVNMAVQDMNRLINEGRELRNREIPRSRGDAAREIEIARGYAAERVNRARGDVARFNSILIEWELNPEITRTRMYYEMMHTIFQADTETELIDRNLDNFIPLMNLQRNEGAR